MVKRHIIDELSSYLDDQLKAGQKEKVEAHLRECHKCREELEKLKAVSEKLKVWQPSGPDADFHRAMSEALLRQEMERGTGKMKKKTLAILIPSGALVSIVALLFVGQLVTQRGFQAGLHDNRGVGGRLKANIDDVGEQYESYYLESGSSSASGSGTPWSANNRMQRDKARIGFSDPADSMKATAMQLARVARDVGREPEDAYKKELSNSSRHIMASSGEGASGGFDQYTSPEAENLAAYEGYDSSKPRASVMLQEELAPQGPVIIVQPVIPATGSEEKVIRTGDISLEVADGKETYQKAAAICKELGGYLADSQFHKNKEGRESGSIIMRIPQDKFLTALEKLGALGKVKGMNTTSEDVSQQYKALKAQLDISMVVYNKMMEAYQKKQVNINEAIRMESELTPILQRIENIKAAIEQLNNTVSMTTITVDFYEPAVSEKTLKESKNLIKETLLASAINSIKFMAAALPKLLVLVVSLVTIIVVSLVMKAWITNLFKKD